MIEPHFVRKGCISWRLVGTAPRLQREIENKERGEGKRARGRERRWEDVMMRRYHRPPLLEEPFSQTLSGKTQWIALFYFFAHLHLLSSDPFSSLIFSSFSSLLWVFPPLLFPLSILSEVWLLNFLRLVYVYIWSYIVTVIFVHAHVSCHTSSSCCKVWIESWSHAQ